MNYKIYYIYHRALNQINVALLSHNRYLFLIIRENTQFVYDTEGIITFKT